MVPRSSFQGSIVLLDHKFSHFAGFQQFFGILKGHKFTYMYLVKFQHFGIEMGMVLGQKKG